MCIIYYFLDMAFLEYFEGPVPLYEEFQTCELVVSKKNFFPAYYTFIISKESSLTGIFNYYLNFQKERGHFNKMAMYYKTPEQDCGGGRGNPIGAKNAISAFVIYILGLSASIALLAAEMLVKKRNKMSKYTK